MRKKLFSILALLLIMAGSAWAQVVITWDTNDIYSFNYGGSYNLGVDTANIKGISVKLTGESRWHYWETYDQTDGTLIFSGTTIDVLNLHDWGQGIPNKISFSSSNGPISKIVIYCEYLTWNGDSQWTVLKNDVWEGSILAWNGSTPAETVDLYGVCFWADSCMALIEGVYSIEFTIEDGSSPTHAHNYSYSASGATITAHCENPGCGLTNDPKLTLKAPADSIYNDEAKTATLSSYSTLVFPGEHTIQYYQGDTLLDGAPVNVGSYTAKVTAQGQTAILDFDIAGREPVRSVTRTSDGSWVVSEVTQYVLVESKYDNFYWMHGGRTYVVRGNVTLARGLVYEDSVDIIMCSGSKLDIQGGIWHLGSVLTINAEEGADDATIMVTGTNTQPALSGGTIIINSGNFSATAADGGQLSDSNLSLLLGQGVQTGASGGTMQPDGYVKFTGAQLASMGSLEVETLTYKSVTLKDDNADADHCTGKIGDATSFSKFPLVGVADGQTVTVKYSGEREVKSISVKVKDEVKSAATVATAPTATTGYIYDSTKTALVSEGTATGGTMMYKVTNVNVKPTSTDGFSASVPTAENLEAGTYYVWYYVLADAWHTSSEISTTSVAVTVSPDPDYFLGGQPIYANTTLEYVFHTNNGTNNTVTATWDGTSFSCSHGANDAYGSAGAYVSVSGPKITLGVSDNWAPTQGVHGFSVEFDTNNDTYRIIKGTYALLPDDITSVKVGGVEVLGNLAKQ